MNISARLSVISLLFVLFILLVAGCGQKGDLYLPEDEAKKKEPVLVPPGTKKSKPQQKKEN